MLLRLLLALTIALLPMPAVASCHVQPVTPMAHHAGMKHEPVKQQAAAEQLCMGCVAPAAVRAPQFAPPLAYIRADAPTGFLTGESLTGTPPATPPPRSEA